ncbi:hypothetical protein AWV79_16060 [Cupriavidus sp. UYMMa02A]|nr:hypothetical protein AWV79_16060 [Cupriavidus sp. UYMMa02A]
MSFTGHTINASLYKNLPLQTGTDILNIPMASRTRCRANRTAGFDSNGWLTSRVAGDPGLPTEETVKLARWRELDVLKRFREERVGGRDRTAHRLWKRESRLGTADWRYD